MVETSTLLDAYVAQRRSLLAAACEVPPARRGVAFVGHWELKDLLAHLVGWDWTNVEAAGDIQRGVLPAFYEHFDPDWAAYNARLVAKHRSDDWAGLLASLEQSQRHVVTRLRSLSAYQLEEPGPVWRDRPITIGGILRAALRDESRHLNQIRAFAGGCGAPQPDAHR